MMRLPSGRIGRHDYPVRVYLPITHEELALLDSGQSLPARPRTGVTATAELAEALSVTETDELALIAALAASDLSDESNVVAVLEAEVEVVDPELGEVRFDAELALPELECLMLADVESEELSWFGIQETADLIKTISKKAG